MSDLDAPTLRQLLIRKGLIVEREGSLPPIPLPEGAKVLELDDAGRRAVAKELRCNIVHR
jgi:hypothetical protein